MNPYDLFNPANYNPLDPSTMMGMIDPNRLLAAAQAFPGGAIALVFALFWAPVGPGIPAGVLLARHAGINPLITLALYSLTDILGALLMHPLYALARRFGSKIGILRWLGRGLMKVALFGTRPPRPEDLTQGARGTWPALFRIATIGFGVDVYHAGMLVAGLPIPRIAGWLAAIAGDMVWFTVLLITSMVTAAVTENDGVNAIVMIVVMVLVPPILKRFVPALRDEPRPPRASRWSRRQLAAQPAAFIAAPPSVPDLNGHDQQGATNGIVGNLSTVAVTPPATVPMDDVSGVVVMDGAVEPNETPPTHQRNHAVSRSDNAGQGQGVSAAKRGERKRRRSAAHGR